MGRTMKRVPMDFAWPLNKTWDGYLNPHRSESCPDCENGYAPVAQLFYKQWYANAPFDPVAYGSAWMTPTCDEIRAFAERNISHSPHYYGTDPWVLDREMNRLWLLWRHQWSHNLCQDDVDALIAEDRLWDFTRVPRTDEQKRIVEEKVRGGGNSWLPESNGYRPTALEVNKWSIRGFGHDGINAGVCIRARCKREGMPLECATCEGHGELWPDPEVKRRYDEWAPTEPPEGDGYQLWETTSEGSPVSPVFSSIEDLCTWCARNATTFGSATATAQQWRKMLDDDFVFHDDGEGRIFM